MSTRSTIVALVLLGLSFAGLTARADGLAIRGTVIGTDGKPLSGAEVRAERTDGKAAVVVTKTDAKGQYSFKGLALATYRVTTLVNKVPKSVASVNTQTGGWARVDFNLSLTATKSGQPAKSKKRYVWVSGETGSHIGGGHWEAVDDTNVGTGAQPMERLDGSVVQQPGSLIGPNAGRIGGN
jgi:Carboxypeptidase regulatory-like domain